MMRKFSGNTGFKKVLLTNIYGTAESGVDAIAYTFSHGSQQLSTTVPVGRPLSNTRAFIFDTAMNPVPIGLPGEICLSGAGLS